MIININKYSYDNKLRYGSISISGHLTSFKNSFVKLFSVESLRILIQTHVDGNLCVQGGGSKKVKP